jgi:hypothetical protein
MEIQRISFNSKIALEKESIHEKGTLVVNVSGIGTYRQNHKTVWDILVQHAKIPDQHMETVFRWNDLTKWYVVLTAAGHLTHHSRLTNTTLKVGSLIISITAVETDQHKGTISGLPYTFRKECVRDIAEKLIKDSKVTVTKVKRVNYWQFNHVPQPGVKIAHHMWVDLYGDLEASFKIVIKLPGRRIKCSVCNNDDHWNKQCLNITSPKPHQIARIKGPAKNNKPLTRPPPISQPNLHEPATSTAEPTIVRADTNQMSIFDGETQPDLTTTTTSYPRGDIRKIPDKETRNRQRTDSNKKTETDRPNNKKETMSTTAIEEQSADRPTDRMIE